MTLCLCWVWLALLFSVPVSAGGNILRVAAGPSWMPRLKELLSGFEQDTGAKLVLPDGDGLSADRTYKAVDVEGADVGFFSGTEQGLMETLASKKYRPVNPGQFKFKPISYTYIHFFTFRGGPRELNQEQIVDLFTGKVKNWKDVGGTDLPVRVVLPPHQDLNLVQRFIVVQCFDGRDFLRKGVKTIKGFRELTEFVGATPGAVGWGLAKQVPHESVNHPKHPDCGMPLMMMTKGEPSPLAMKLVETYLKQKQR